MDLRYNMDYRHDDEPPVTVRKEVWAKVSYAYSSIRVVSVEGIHGGIQAEYRWRRKDNILQLEARRKRIGYMPSNEDPIITSSYAWTGQPVRL